MNRAAKRAPYIPVASESWLLRPCKRRTAGNPHATGSETEDAPQVFIHRAVRTNLRKYSGIRRLIISTDQQNHVPRRGR